MKFWRFYDYVSPAGNNLIEEWYAGQPVDVQVAFDVTLNNLAGYEAGMTEPSSRCCMASMLA